MNDECSFVLVCTGTSWRGYYETVELQAYNPAAEVELYCGMHREMPAAHFYLPPEDMDWEPGHFYEITIKRISREEGRGRS